MKYSNKQKESKMSSNKYEVVKTVLFGIVILALLVGCTKDDDPVSPVEPLPIFKQNANFPLDISNIWKYHFESESENATTQVLVTDSVRHTDGTLLHVMHDGILNFPNDEYVEYYYGNREGNIYFYNSKTGTYDDGLGHQTPVTKKIILKDTTFVGQTWISIDTCKVISFSNLDIDSLSINDVYAVESKRLYSIDTLYFAKNIGIVKHDYEYRDFGKGTSEIYDYSIDNK
jgi:hypothetical protein